MFRDRNVTAGTVTLRTTGGQSPRRHLVVVRAGPGYVPADFCVDDATRTYDVIICAWHDTAGKSSSEQDRWLHYPGQKLDGYARLFRDNPGLLTRYDAIALIDDDIEASVCDINTCFETGLLHGLGVWQPSLTHDSYFTYAACLHHPAFRMRYTNFVEMMCPFFTPGLLRRALPMFELGYSVGPDLLWTRLEANNHGRAAIIDRVQVRHTREVTSALRKQTGGQHTNYDAVVTAFLTAADEQFRGVVIYGAERADGRRTVSRLGISLALFSWFRALDVTPMARAKFVRRVSDAIRHTLTRPVNIERSRRACEGRIAPLQPETA